MIADKQDTDGRPHPSQADHLVLVSLGNTRAAIAAWTEERRAAAGHFGVDRLDEALDELERLWNSFPAQATRAVVVGSVNPPRLREFAAGCERRQIEPVLVVGESLELPLQVDLPEPERVGTDRLCAAAAAFARMKTACVVADFGSAVTIDLVGDDGVFLGGTIFPGMAMCARALHEYTAQLPLVEVAGAAEIIGKSTVGAIRGGILGMMAGALREITERYATEVGKWPPLIVTGGDAEVVAGACDFVDRVVPDLGLDGLVIAYQQSFPSNA